MKANKRIYLKEITLKDYKCFKGDNTFSFVHDDGKRGYNAYQWTILLGNNGTGKTNLLKAIANLEPRKADYTNQPADVTDMYLEFQSEKGVKVVSKGRSEDEPFQPKVRERYKGATDYRIAGTFVATNAESKNLSDATFAQLYRKTTKGGGYASNSPAQLAYTAMSNEVDPTEELENLQIYAYGVTRMADKSGLNTIQKDSAESLFADNVSLLNFEDWLLQLELAKGQNKPGAGRRLKLLEDIFKRSSLFPDLEGFKLVTDNDFNNHIEFQCTDGTYRFQDLGYGYQCMLAWIFDFSKRMFDRYPLSENPLKEAAVVLIDEIDLHLHPKWQRSLLKDLSEFFPNTQFIVSTHSPLIVQSMKNVNLYVLKRDKDSKSVWVERKENTDWEGWQMEEILGEVMDVDNCYTSEQLKAEIDHFDKAVQEDDLDKAEQIFLRIGRSVNPNGAIAQMLNAQIRELRNYHHEAY